MQQPQAKKSKQPVVIAARSILGVQLGHTVANSLNVGKNCDFMEMTPWGLKVVVKTKEANLQYIVPYSNLQTVQFENQVDEE